MQINIKEGETNFARFYHYDSENVVSWNLVQNKNEVLQEKKDATPKFIFTYDTGNLLQKCTYFQNLKKQIIF